MKSRSPISSTAVLGFFVILLVVGLAWISGGLTSEPDAPAVAIALGDGLELESETDLAVRTDVESADHPNDSAMTARRAVLGAKEEATRELLASGDGIAFTGQVLAALGEVPLAGATIALAGEGWEVETESGPAGLFTAQVPERVGIGMRVSMAGYAPFVKAPANVGAGDAPAELIIKLAQEGRILGTLKGPAAEKPELGKAELWDLRVPGSESEEPQATSAIDSEGQFEFGELRTSEYLVCVTYPGCRLTHVPYVSVESGETTEVNAQPEPGGSITGEVLDMETKLPLAGVHVRAKLRFATLGRMIGLSELSTETDADGRYTFTSLIPGEHRVQVTAPWGTTRSEDVSVFESDEQVEQDFELTAPGKLSGTVKNVQKLGIGGATVSIRWDAIQGIESEELALGQGAGSRTIRADTNGLFAFEDLPTGRQLFLTAESGSGGPDDLHARPTVQSLRPGQDREDVEIFVREATTFRGLVHDESKRPIAGVEVEVSQSPEAKSRRSTKKLFHSTVVSDESGEFEIQGLVPDPYSLVLTHADYLPNTKNVRVRDGHDPDKVMRIQLHQGEVLKGFVENENFEAVPYARISVQSITAPGRGKKREKQISVRADAYGRFVISNLMPGEFTLNAKASGHESLPVEERVVMPMSGELRLELRTKLQVPRATLTGRLLRRDGGELERIRATGLRGGSISWHGDAFEVQGVQAGIINPRFDADDCLPFAPGKLSVAPGGTLNLGTMFLSPAAELFVFVRTKAGKPVAGVTARLIPVDDVAKSSGKKQVKMGTKKTRHRFKGTNRRQNVTASYTQYAPFGEWKLDVRAPGMAKVVRPVTFNESKLTQRLEVTVEPPKKKKPKTNLKKPNKGKVKTKK